MNFGYAQTIVLVLVGLYILREFVLINTADYPLKLKVFGYASYALVGAFVSTIMFTGGDLLYVGALWVVCAPTWGYSCYLFYKEDKKKVIESYIVVTTCIIISFVFSYM